MKKYIKTHLSVKIFLLTFCILISIAAVTYSFIAAVTPKSYLAELDRSLDRAIESLLENLERASIQECKSMLKVFEADHSTIVQLYDQEGMNVELDGEVELFFERAPGAIETDSQPIDEFGIKEYQFTPADEEALYTLQVLGNRQSVNLFSQSLFDLLPMLIVIISIVAAGVAWIYSRYVTRPVIQVSERSKELAKLTLKSYHLNEREDEIGVLEENLNELSERLAAALEELQTANESLQKDIETEKEMEKQQLAFFAAVSHELKTPITVLKGQVQGMLYGVGGYKDRDKYLSRAYEVIEGMEKLVLEILSVSRMRSSGFSMDKKALNLHQAVRTVIEKYEELAVHKQIQLVEDFAPVPAVSGDPGLLDKAFSNIMSNAVRYSPEGATVRIKIRQEEEYVLLAIENTGVHLQEEEISSLFKAFVRGEESRNKKTGGTGLGLYLVQMIFTLHGYSYEMKNSEEGICFEVRLK